jgi:ABC-2 type transport system permease protein
VALPTWALSRPGRRPVVGQQALAKARRQWSVRGVWWRALRAESAAILWWALALGASTAWITLLARTLARSIADMIATTPALAALFRDFAMGTDTGFLGGILLFYLPALLALQALTAALAWTGDLEGGRLELVLATARPRWRILLERAAIVPLGAVSLPLASWAAMLATARLADMAIDAGRLTVAYLGLVPLGLLTGAVAYALAGWLRRGGVVAVCGTLIAVSYFADVLNPLLDLPGWALDLSIFHQYGRPVTDDPRWGAWLALTALAAGLMGLGVARFARADV